MFQPSPPTSAMPAMSAMSAKKDPSRDVLPGALAEIHDTLLSIQQDYRQLTSTVEAIEGRVNILAGIKEVTDTAASDQGPDGKQAASIKTKVEEAPRALTVNHENSPSASLETKPSPSARSSATSSRIILTTYPGQAGMSFPRICYSVEFPQTRRTCSLRMRKGLLL